MYIFSNKNMDENKNQLKRSVKRTTTSVQFQKLVDLLETFPHLASGSPSSQFGHPRSEMEADWSSVAESLNSIGPPIRTVQEWKKTWSDLRSRTRLNIIEISKCDLYLTEGRSKPLNALEIRVATLCKLIPSANPTPLSNVVPESRPINRVAAVTPNLSSTLPKTLKNSPPRLPTPLTMPSSKTVQKAKEKKISKQKRQTYAKELELLRKQVTAQESIADAMKSQVMSAEEHKKSLNKMAETCKLIASSMSDFIKLLK